jgi:hypothetical protein
MLQKAYRICLPVYTDAGDSLSANLSSGPCREVLEELIKRK